MRTSAFSRLFFACAVLSGSACGNDGVAADESGGETDSNGAEVDSGQTVGDGDGDAATSGDGDATTSGDGDATTSGDGDGTSGDGDGDGDGTSGDGDGTTGDGDGDGTSGDGDGDGTSGDGDGDGTSGDGDGDGDGTSGDGDGDGTSGDGDGDGDGDGTTGDGDGDGDGTTGDGDGDGDGDGTTGDGDGDGFALCDQATPCPPTQLCNGHFCVAAPAPLFCENGNLDGVESDVDCGGDKCLPCDLGDVCVSDADCGSLNCGAGLTCVPPVPSYTLDEDFETGDFSLFPYGFMTDGANNWTIETVAAECHGGAFCARTNVFQELGETSKLLLPLSVRQADQVSFWVKTDTEPGNYYFRFYIDGVLESEISGQNGWQLITVPVPATGAGGPDRVLEWEYYRSTFVDGGHAPWTTVWIDDIDMPEWNTPPTVPQGLLPGNGAVVDTTSPTLYWGSKDPDFDTITYEMQYDTDPAFGSPASTGETFEVSTEVGPLTDASTYYWRVRSKDDSDYRWSQWSPTSTFRVDDPGEYPVRWEQTLGPEFALGTFVGTEVVGNSIRVSGQDFEVTGSTTQSDGGSPWPAWSINEVTFSGLPLALAGSTGTIAVTAGASTRSGNTCNTVDEGFGANARIDGVSQGSFATVDIPECTCTTVSDSVSVPDVDTFVNPDGEAEIRLTTGGYYGLNASWTFFCNPQHGNPSYGEPVVTLSYPSALIGTATSVPICLASLGGVPNWEKVHVDGTPGLTFQLLDADLNVIPDAAVPGNSTGLPPGTHMLWDLDAEAYPVVHVQVELSGNQELRSWQLYGNDGYKWHFANDGYTEGWVAGDTGDTPVVSVAGGLLRFEGLAAGSNPNLVYTFPVGVDASRFTQLTVNQRTSNNAQDDDVTLWWENNFGLFDPVRTFVETEYMFSFTSAVFDLTQSVSPPQQPWQGTVFEMRVDPVERFVDAATQPEDGWLEVDYIWLQ